MYSIREDGQLSELVETPYELEEHLQSIIAAHPKLLGGAQMDVAAPRKLLLVASEAGLPSSEKSGNAFAIDLVFIDQDAIPTIVEVKRSSDTRLRREVVGQILEYAANVCAFWSAEKIRALYENTTASSQSLSTNESLEAAFGFSVGEADAYWRQLEANLELKRIRLVLVADKISTETLRIIEFLNQQMVNVDVFAVTIAQFTDGKNKTLTPRVLNASLGETDRKTRTARRGVQWTRERFYDELNKNQPGAAAVYERIERWAFEASHVGIEFGFGISNGSMILYYHSQDSSAGYRSGPDVVFLTLWSLGTLEITFQYLAGFRAFRATELRVELVERLNNIGFEIIAEKIDKRPNVSWSKVSNLAILDKFLSVQDWLCDNLARS